MSVSPVIFRSKIIIPKKRQKIPLGRRTFRSMSFLPRRIVVVGQKGRISLYKRRSQFPHFFKRFWNPTQIIPRFKIYTPRHFWVTSFKKTKYTSKWKKKKSSSVYRKKKTWGEKTKSESKKTSYDWKMARAKQNELFRSPEWKKWKQDLKYTYIKDFYKRDPITGEYGPDLIEAKLDLHFLDSDGFLKSFNDYTQNEWKWEKFYAKLRRRKDPTQKKKRGGFRGVTNVIEVFDKNGQFAGWRLEKKPFRQYENYGPHGRGKGEIKPVLILELKPTGDMWKSFGEFSNPQYIGSLIDKKLKQIRDRIEEKVRGLTFDIVPKDTGQLRATICDSIAQSEPSWHGIKIEISADMEYAQVANNMPTRMLAHPHEGGKKKGRTGNLLWDPKARTSWFRELVDIAKREAHIAVYDMIESLTYDLGKYGTFKNLGRTEFQKKEKMEVYSLSSERKRMDSQIMYRTIETGATYKNIDPLAKMYIDKYGEIMRGAKAEYVRKWEESFNKWYEYKEEKKIPLYEDPRVLQTYTAGIEGFDLAEYNKHRVLALSWQEEESARGRQYGRLRAKAEKLRGEHIQKLYDAWVIRKWWEIKGLW